jgi:hypothetical protein
MSSPLFLVVYCGELTMKCTCDKCLWLRRKRIKGMPDLSSYSPGQSKSREEEGTLKVLKYTYSLDWGLKKIVQNNVIGSFQEIQEDRPKECWAVCVATSLNMGVSLLSIGNTNVFYALL